MSIARYYIRRFALRNRFAADLKYLLIASANILNQPERKNKAKPVEMAFVRYAFPFDVLLQSRLGLVGRRCSRKCVEQHKAGLVDHAEIEQARYFVRMSGDIKK